MNWILAVLVWIPVGIVALYFLIVGALYAFAVGFAKFGIGYPFKEMLPHPETGEPIEVTGLLRFESRLSLLIWALSGHKYAQCMGWLVKGVMRVVVCIADLDLEGEALYHELVVHGRQWARYRYRMPFLQGRAIILHGYPGSKFERNAREGGKKWGSVTPNVTLKDGRVVREYANPKARQEWEETWGLRPKAGV
jgi:hypothetical protein